MDGFAYSKRGDEFWGTNGEPAILSIIHSLTVDGTQEYDFRTTYDKVRDMLTKVFPLLVNQSQISINHLLAPGTVLSRLLDDPEKRRIMTFPTSAQLRDAVADPGVAMDPEDEAFTFIENSDGRLFQSTQGFPEYRIPLFPALTLGRPCI